MRVTIACIGRLKGAEKEMCERYAKRIQSAGKQVSFDNLQISELIESKQRSVQSRKDEEAKMLMKKIPPQAHFFQLDETGKNFTTAQFSKKIKNLRDDNIRDIAFILGGADGLSQKIASETNNGQVSAGKISLGAMTMPHGLARVVLLEQLYRIMTLWSGHPYHRE